MTKDEATKTAAARLEAIERFGRATCFATMTCACILAVFLAGFTYLAVDYLRMKSAYAEISARFDKP